MCNRNFTVREATIVFDMVICCLNAAPWEHCFYVIDAGYMVWIPPAKSISPINSVADNVDELNIFLIKGIRKLPSVSTIQVIEDEFGCNFI